MCRKLVYLLFGALIFCVALTGTGKADLVGWWRLDEGSGTTATDRSGNGNDGALQGDPQWVLGRISGALQFDGVDDWVEVPHAEILTVDNEVTVMAWINAERHTGPGGATWQGILAKSNDPRSYSLYTEASGVLHFSTAGVGTLSTDQVELNEWAHVAALVINGGHTYYINGEPAGTSGSGIGLPGTQDTAAFLIGDTHEGSREFLGKIDDVRIYSRGLTQEEIQIAMLGEGQPFAFGPNPEDGAIHEDTWVTLSWRAGDFVVTHDVYLGENFDDVNDGTGDTFRGNQGATFYIAGFPGFAYPEGLVPGSTYYWRIDEVNDADPNSPWKGQVWSFSVPPKKAYHPIPSNGAKFIDPDLSTLTWAAGFKAKLHTLYFGDDFETMNNAVAGIPVTSTSYTIPGSPLQREKTYYWRVDEFDGIETHKGDVWSFTIAGEGGGLRAYFYHWTGDFPPANPFQSFVVSEVVSEIDWNWGNNPPHPLVNADDFAIKFTGDVEAAFTETYTFHVTTDDGQRLWVDGQPIIDRWIQQGMTEHRGTIDLVAGRKVSIELWMYEHSGGAVCEMRWSSPSTNKQIVPRAALSLPLKARDPQPINKATGASMSPILTWTPGEQAASHEVYFDTDADVVANATKASPEFKATKALGEESYDPGKLTWHTTYYWRVDEVNNLNPDSPWVGNVWSFTTGDFLLVDNFESYTDNDADGEAIWQTWIDGLGAADNGAQVGYLMPPYAEKTLVHGGFQSMPLLYTDETDVTNSEASLTLSFPRDWTEEGVEVLSLWLRGYTTNAAEPLYVTISNAAGAPAVVANDDPAAATIEAWEQWRVPLQAFADQGIDLGNVDKIAIGLGSKSGLATPGGTGTMYIDDIRLYRSNP